MVKYLASHHCPLQQSTQSREAKLECPKCGNLVKQKYLKIHQKNHCVGIKSSTFSNFRTAPIVQVRILIDRFPYLAIPYDIRYTFILSTCNINRRIRM